MIYTLRTPSSHSHINTHHNHVNTPATRPSRITIPPFTIMHTTRTHTPNPHRIPIPTLPSNAAFSRLTERFTLLWEYGGMEARLTSGNSYSQGEKYR